jgi:peptidoglycan/LPS O-acetylase OafA/YrhL
VKPNTIAKKEKPVISFLSPTISKLRNTNLLNGDNHVNSLTGLRAIAAGIVVLHHLVPTSGKGWLASTLEEFNIGVTIFFVLSGFLITYRYLEKFEKTGKWFYNYAVNRVARIYPMYFLLTTYTFVLGAMANHKINIQEYLLNITFLRGFFSEYVYSGIAQGWTLTVEECFYFSAPLLFIFSRRLPILIQAAIVFATGFLFYLVFRHTNFHGFMNSLPHIYITTYFGRVFEFVAGVLLAFALMKNKRIKHATLIGSFGFLALLIIQIVINHATGKYAIITLPGYFINSFLTPIAVALIIHGLIKEPTPVNTFLQSKVMVLLGKSSYTLYLLHWGMTSYLINRFVSPNFIVNIVLTYLLSIVLWYVVEEPCNRYIRTFKR